MGFRHVRGALILRRWIISIILLALMLTGCHPAGAHLRDEVNQQESKIAEMQQELAGKREELGNMIDQINELTKIKAEIMVGRNFDIESQFYTDLLNEHPWLEKFKERTIWDSMVISRYEGDPEAQVIDDPLIIESVDNPYYCIQHVTTESYPNGYPMNYVFDFYEGEEKYSLVLVDQYAILAGQYQLMLWPDCDIYRVVEAFMPALPFVKHDGLIAKMAASGAVRRGDVYVQFAGYRVRSKVWPLVSEEVQLLEEEPEQTGERIERFTFYYHGDELYMDVYPQHVHLLGQGEESWYFHERADEVFLFEPG